VELLPWEPFGVAKAPQSTVTDTDDVLALVDRAARLTAAGDDPSVEQLLALAQTDPRLRPPDATISAALAADVGGPVFGNSIET
jgi:hypothetical protein